MQVQPLSENQKFRPRTWPRRLLVVGLLVGAVVAWVSDRRPVDVTRPIFWQTPQTLHPADRHVLRIASYNIHGGKGRDGFRDLSRIAADLHSVDFAGLYEVHAGTWGLSADQATVLGEQLGMRSAYLGTERRWWRDHVGNAVLTSMPVSQLQRIPLVGTRGKAFRQAVLVDVPWNDRMVHLLLVHVDRERDRESQLTTVIQLFQGLESPAVLMGDLNSGPDDPQLVELLARPGVESVLPPKLDDRTAAGPVDWIITRGLECVTAELIDSGASDHPVVKATLKLP